MHTSRHRLRRALCALFAVGFVVVLATLLPGAAAAAPAPVQPAGAAQAVQSPAAAKPDPALNVNLSLLGLKVHLSVPLTLHGLLGGLGGKTTTPAAPSSTAPHSPPAGATTSAPSAPGGHTSRARSTGSSGQSDDGAGSRFDNPAPAPKTHTTRASSSHPAGRPSSSQHSSADAAPFVLGRRATPATASLVLIGVLAATALGVALVVRMSGRRGSHQT